MNPFRYGQVVTGNYFCPRPNLSKLLMKHIESNQNVHIEGERRTGKTSLIIETTQNIKGCVLIHIDLFQVKSAHDIYKRILDGISQTQAAAGLLSKLLNILKHLRPTVGVDSLTGSPTFTISASQNVDPENITGLLDFIYQEYSSKNTVVFFDEFQDIKNVPEYSSILAQMRSRIQLHDLLTYIYAGSIRNEMNTIFYDPASPFYKSSLAFAIESFETDNLSSWITDKFRSGKRDIPKVIIDHVFDITNTITGDIMEFCNALWEVSASNTQITEELFEDALEVIYAREKRYFESVMPLLTDIQTRVLKGVAQFNGKHIYSQELLHETGIKQTSTIKRAVSRLLSLRIIYLNNDRQHKFTNPFFRLWLIR